MTLRLGLPAVGIAFAMLGSGCASIETCDPNAVNNVVTAGFCGSGDDDYYAQRRENLRANSARLNAAVEEERIALSKATSRIRQAQAEQRITDAQAQALNGQIAAMHADVDRLARTNDPAEAAALQQQIDRQKAAINGYADLPVF